jgi:hypothetical protein
MSSLNFETGERRINELLDDFNDDIIRLNTWELDFLERIKSQLKDKDYLSENQCNKLR